jgi:hypothetical protein
MKKYGYYYRGVLYETTYANDYMDAVIAFDKLGYNMSRGDVVEIR